MDELLTISETNIKRLLKALDDYNKRTNSYFPVDSILVESEILKVWNSLNSRSNDVQSRINRLFASNDTLQDDTRTLIKLSIAISCFDDNIDMSLGHIQEDII